MVRSAFVAVLAVALSSSVAAAQPADLEIDVLAAVGFDATAPEGIALTAIANDFALTELAQPALNETTVDSFAPQVDFVDRAELLFARHINRAQDFLTRTRLNASSMFTLARSRPRFGLYATQGTLQALDILTTTRALEAGHQEANPLFKGGNRAAMVIVKSASFGLHVYLTERLAERRPKTAKWLMVATNAFMSIVVANNLAVGESAAR